MFDVCSYDESILPSSLGSQELYLVTVQGLTEGVTRSDSRDSIYYNTLQSIMKVEIHITKCCMTQLKCKLLLTIYLMKRFECVFCSDSHRWKS